MSEETDRADRAERDRVIATQPNYMFIPYDANGILDVAFCREATIDPQYLRRTLKNKNLNKTNLINWTQFTLKAIAYDDPKRKGIHFVEESVRFVLVAERFAGEWSAEIALKRKPGVVEDLIRRFHSGEIDVRNLGRVHITFGPNINPSSGYVIDLHSLVIATPDPNVLDVSKNTAILRFYEELQNDESHQVWKNTTAFSIPSLGEIQVDEMQKIWAEELKKRVAASDAKRKLTVYGPIDDLDYI